MERDTKCGAEALECDGAPEIAVPNEIRLKKDPDDAFPSTLAEAPGPWVKEELEFDAKLLLGRMMLLERLMDAEDPVLDTLLVTLEP